MRGWKNEDEKGEKNGKIVLIEEGVKSYWLLYRSNKTSISLLTCRHIHAYIHAYLIHACILSFLLFSQMPTFCNCLIACPFHAVNKMVPFDLILVFSSYCRYVQVSKCIWYNISTYDILSPFVRYDTQLVERSSPIGEILHSLIYFDTFFSHNFFRAL